MIKNIIFDLGNVLIKYIPENFLEKNCGFTLKEISCISTIPVFIIGAVLHKFNNIPLSFSV